VSDPASDPGLELDLAAAELRADSLDLDALVAALAARLEDALPHFVIVKRSRVGGFRSKETEVRTITLNLGDARFELERTVGGFACTRHAVVRGITLRREEQPLDAWVDDVVAAVAQTAGVGEQARIALEGLVR
jgi:AcrR family transcriptional regulator